MPLFCALLVLLAALLPIPVAAQPASPWEQAAALPAFDDIAQSAPPALLGQALAGRWRGTLHYRDFGSDKGVTLPTEVVIDGAGEALRLAYTYDDGPGKTVRSSETWSFDGATLRMGKEGEPMTVTRYRGNAKGELILLALGSGVENGAPVEVRSVVMRRGPALSISRASRLPGQAWLLRHIYRFTPAE